MCTNLYLTINTAERLTQFLISRVVINKNQDTSSEILYSQMSEQVKASTEFLIPALDEACQKLGISIHDISHIAAVTGPGNFMGIRMSAVTVSALMRVLPKRTVQTPLNYMQCLALNIPYLAHFFSANAQLINKNHTEERHFLNALKNISGKIVRVLTSATKNSVHLCDFTFKEEDGKFFAYPNFTTVLYDLEYPVENNIENTINTNLTKNNAHYNLMQNTQELHIDFILGSGLQAHEEFFKARFPHAQLITESMLENLLNTSAELLNEEYNTFYELKQVNTFFEIPLSSFAHTPSMQSLYTLTTHTQTKWQKEDLNPLYLKACDALQNLDHIATMQGRDPKNAHAHLAKLMNTSL